MARKKTKKSSPKNKSWTGGRGTKRQRPFWRDLIFKKILPAGLVSSLIIAGVWFVVSGRYNAFRQKMTEAYVTTTAEKGFVVENIIVKGRHYLDKETVQAVVNARKGDPIFLFEPAEVRQQLENLSWVKTARIERRLPDTLVIEINERKPFVLWQHRQRLALIDNEGVVLTAEDLGNYGDRLIVVGPHAHEEAYDLVRFLEAEPSIFEKTESAIHIGDRRWDLKLENDILVRLPENEMGLALSHLAKMHREENILAKDITLIDMRISDKIVIRPSTRANAKIERPRFTPSREGDKDI